MLIGLPLLQRLGMSKIVLQVFLNIKIVFPCAICIKNAVMPLSAWLVAVCFLGLKNNDINYIIDEYDGSDWMWYVTMGHRR